MHNNLAVGDRKSPLHEINPSELSDLALKNVKESFNKMFYPRISHLSTRIFSGFILFCLTTVCSSGKTVHFLLQKKKAFCCLPSAACMRDIRKAGLLYTRLYSVHHVTVFCRITLCSITIVLYRITLCSVTSVM